MTARILILCTGNSARSQMAEGWMKSFDAGLEVRSAGTQPASRVHPAAIEVMREIGIDISGARPKNVSEYLEQPFDLVITVCDDADRTCPAFQGKVARRVHLGFADPAKTSGSAEEVRNAFRTVRDQIRDRLYEFYVREIKPGG